MSAGKQLLVLRHAKSSRPKGVDDHDRPLAPRGIWAAEAMADQCARRFRKVELALCSSAIRCRETLRLLERCLPPSAKIDIDEGLYLADSRDLVATLRRVHRDHESLLLVGHEPGLSELVVRLCGDDGKATAQRRLAKGLKPGSLAVIDLDLQKWSRLRAGSGRLRAVVRPKDLR